MSFGYRALHRSDSFIHLSSASPSIMYRQPSRSASISSLTSELSSNVQSRGLEQGRLHGFLQRIGHRRRRRSGYSEQNNASDKENYVSLCDEMESCCPDPGPVSSLKVTDKHYGGDTDEMVFIKRHRHQRSQMAEASSENDPATPMPQGSGGEPSWLKEMGSLHPSGRTRTVRSTSFSARGEYLRLEEPVVNNYVRPVRRTSHFEKLGNSKQWIETVDMEVMYYSNQSDGTYILWCDGHKPIQVLVRFSPPPASSFRSGDFDFGHYC